MHFYNLCYFKEKYIFSSPHLFPLLGFYMKFYNVDNYVFTAKMDGSNNKHREAGSAYL